MKLICILFLCLTGVCSSIRAQDSVFLHQQNKERIAITQKSMLVLGGWAVLNIGSGIAGNFAAGGEAKYMHQMNAIWNTVNLGIAAAGYFGSRRQLPGSFSWQQSLSEQNKAERIYMVNAALDLAYITGGLALRAYGGHRSPGRSQDRWKGYGTSLIAQGAFLLLYDGINYTIHVKHGRKLHRRFNDIEIGIVPGGFSLLCTL